MGNDRNYFKELRSVALSEGQSGRRDRYSNSEVITLEWNSPANRIAASKTDRSLRIWKLQGSEPNGQLPVIIDSAHEKPVESISWDPHSEISFATVGNDQYVRIWNSVCGKLIKEINTQEKKNFIIKHSGDSKYIAVVSKENGVIIIDAKIEIVVHRIQLELDIYSIAWNNTSSFFFIGLGNGTIRVYKFTEEKLIQIHILTGHRSSVKSLKFDPRGKLLYAGSNEGVISVWSLEDFVLIRTIGEVDQSVSQIDSTRDANYVSATFEDGSGMRIYELSSGEQVFSIDSCMAGKQTSPLFRFCPIRTTFAYSTTDGSVYVAAK